MLIIFYFKIIPYLHYYIATRERKLHDYKKALKFLESYRWSSNLDYMGRKNFPSVTQREFLLNFFAGTKEYERGVKEWLKDLDTEILANVTLE